ncbi:MAG: DUF2336 domain-containing protein [Pseudomonadota bacterium]
MSTGPLERLISLDQNAPSDERREVLRAVTDSFIVASDRYGRRDMALFDILLSRSANAMDLRLRKLIVMTLIRAGARDEHVKHALTTIPSPNERFLRRSVLQPVNDLQIFLQENADTKDIPEGISLHDSNSIQLPSAILYWLFHYQLTIYRDALLPRIGADRIGLMERTAIRFQDQIINTARETGRDEVVVARRTISDWIRRQAMTEEVLTELLEARAMTEFMLAAAHMFDIDTSTMIRTVNDTSFQSLAILMKSHNVRRATFGKIITGFRYRKTDRTQAEAILPLYDRLTPEAAIRAVRFLRVRVSDLSCVQDESSFAEAG